MTNVWYVKNILENCDGSLYLPILHLPKEELHCKLQEKLHHVTGPLGIYCMVCLQVNATLWYTTIQRGIYASGFKYAIFGLGSLHCPLYL